MTTPARPLGLFLMFAAVFASCRSPAPVTAAVLPPPEQPSPSVHAQWLVTQASVLTMVAENRTVAADSSLSQFARDFARTPEGDRARWWRTLMRVDPRVAGSDPSVAIAQIDSLLADSVAMEVRAEAVLMRRTIGAIDSLRRSELRRRAQATQLAGERLDELKLARDSVTKLTAEIDRLRRRLRAP
ncbi:MAG TPA: hypothetical protein VE861_03515 [Gemmatimonadaceae bacterium]|nr:hypothetical protein [Gemmatimonadaceae bacterium]